MKLKPIIITVAIIVLAAFTYSKFLPESKGEYDLFAKCLAESGTKMFGAFWCPHCQSQKEEFGASWKYIDYIECSTADRQQTLTCQQEGIKSYPTWEYPDGTRSEGVSTWEELAEKSGCELSIIV